MKGGKGSEGIRQMKKTYGWEDGNRGKGIKGEDAKKKKRKQRWNRKKIGRWF